MVSPPFRLTPDELRRWLAWHDAWADGHTPTPMTKAEYRRYQRFHRIVSKAHTLIENTTPNIFGLGDFERAILRFVVDDDARRAAERTGRPAAIDHARDGAAG